MNARKNTRLRLAVLVLLGIPSLAAAQEPPTGGPAAAPRAPGEWQVGLSVVQQGIFDPGMRLFSGDRFATALEARASHELAADRVHLAWEGAYGISRSRKSLGGGSEGDLILQNASLGIRGAIELGALRPFARAGAAAMHGTALVHDPYRDHREEGFTPGAYGAGGLEVDMGPITGPGNRLVLSAEAGHLWTPGLRLGRMGTLGVNGVFFGAGASVRF